MAYQGSGERLGCQMAQASSFDYNKGGEDSLRKEVVTIIALESAEAGWSFTPFDKEYFMIEECEAPLYAVPYFINGRVYILCLTPSFKIIGDEMRPAIDRKALQESVLTPLMSAFS